VTGAGGFIGSHLIEELANRGHSIRAFVRYNSRADWGLLHLLPAELLPAIEVISGDLRDADAVRRAMEGCNRVFHLGALIAIPYSYVHPREVVDTNIMGTLNILSAARDLSVDRVVHTSTSEVYGTAQYVPIDETHPLQGQSPYSASKIGADKIVESFHLSFDLPVVTVRPFNTYGPRQSARAVIPTIISQALQSDVIKLGDLKPERDFLFVSDTVEGFIRASNQASAEGKTINLGANKTISIGELAEMISGIIGKNARISVEDQRFRPEKSEVQRLQADNRLANEVLGWAPKISLGEGLKRTIEWIKRHPAYYRPGEYQV
jgi:dTDP-glucose 4,6-dehydratase